MRKKIYSGVGLVLMLVLGYLIYEYYPRLGIITGYSAKRVCSCKFIADRTLEQIESEDLATNPLLGLATNTINLEARSATSAVFGLQSKTAEYRGKLGCVLVQGKDDYEVKMPTLSSSAIHADSLLFPYGTKVQPTKTSDADHSIIRDAADQMFDPNGMIADLKTLGLLVLHKDTLIYERYADGYDAGTELLGWSMTKSIMNSWVGMMVKDGRLQLESDNLFAEWKNDGRSKITLNDLMQMSSGLEWNEHYGSVSPATEMLYNSESNGHIAMMQPLEYTPGDVWEYSSGTSNIISLYLRNQYRDHDDYLRYIHERLFIPLGMESTVLETDESGTYIGSSYTYATTRDWARFGTLYLRDGTWNGDRLLPKDWIAYTREVAPASGGVYGAQFWTNADGAELPDAPHDMYSCNGFEGQRVFIIPSHDLVIVRMGLNSHVDFNSLIRDIVGAVPIVK